MVGGDGGQTAASDHGDAGSLGRDARARHGVVRVRGNRLFARTDLQRQRPLSGLGQQLVWLEAMVDLRRKPETVEAARREDDGVQAALAAFSQAGVDVPAKGLDARARLERK